MLRDWDNVYMDGYHGTNQEAGQLKKVLTGDFQSFSLKKRGVRL